MTFTKTSITFVALFVAIASGQGTASLAGRVVDITSAVAPGASVVLARGIHTEQATTADGKGEFRFQNLPAGDYDLTAQWTGFKIFRLSHITIAAGESRTLPDIPLNVGSMCGYPYPDFSLSKNVTKGEIDIRVWRTPYGKSERVPARKMEIKIEGPEANIISGRTDGQGYFRVRGLNPGIYRFPDSHSTYITFLFAGWKETFELSMPWETCPEAGCDSRHPPRKQPIFIYE